VFFTSASPELVEGTFEFDTEGFGCPESVSVTKGRFSFHPASWFPYGDGGLSSDGDAGSCQGTLADTCTGIPQGLCKFTTGCDLVFTTCNGAASNPCSSYTNQADCEAVQCSWYANMCAGTNMACDRFIIAKATCMLAGCTYTEGGCLGTPTPCESFTSISTCAKQTDQTNGCKWY
jgi:hypothetical protein